MVEEETKRSTESAVLSKPRPINRGVPKGSILGLVLFVLIRNTCNYGKMVMYTVDSVLISTNKEVYERRKIQPILIFLIFFFMY